MLVDESEQRYKYTHNNLVTQDKATCFNDLSLNLWKHNSNCDVQLFKKKSFLLTHNNVVTKGYAT